MEHTVIIQRKKGLFKDWGCDSQVWIMYQKGVIIIHIKREFAIEGSK